MENNTFLWSHLKDIDMGEDNGKIIYPIEIIKGKIYYSTSTTKYFRDYPDFNVYKFAVESGETYSSYINFNRIIITDSEYNTLYYNMIANNYEIEMPENTAYAFISTNYTYIKTGYFLYKGTKEELNNIKYYLPNNVLLKNTEKPIIAPEDTTFFTLGKNIFDKDSTTHQVGYISNNGNIGQNENYTLFDYVKIKPNTTYTLYFYSTLTQNHSAGSVYYCLFNSAKKVINGGQNAVSGYEFINGYTFTTPENCHYIRFSFATKEESIDNVRIQIEEGDTFTGYEDYSITIDPKYIKENDEEASLITPEDTTFFIQSKNLIDESTLISGYYISQINGDALTNANHTASDFIAIKPNTTYIFTNKRNSYDSYRYCIYDSNKAFISGYLNPETTIFTTPPFTAYYRFSNSSSNIIESMLEIGDTHTNYTKYTGAIINPDYIYIDENAASTEDNDFIINLPLKMYALVGYEFNIYFDNLVDGHDTDYKFDVSCNMGMHMERCFTVTPTEAEVGEHSITIWVTKDDLTISKTGTIYVASASAKADEHYNIIVLGDSTTNNGICVTKLNENLSEDVMSITTLGTRGTAPNNHEGRSGWKWRTYYTSASETYTDGRGTVDNPFYNETTQTFDIANYFSETGFMHPDYFFINLGINDTFGYNDDASLNTEIAYLNTLCDGAISQIQDLDPDIKICIVLTIPPNYSQDAYGKAYKNGQTRNRYKRNNIIWVKNLIDKYQNRESENIYVIPLNLCLDTVYNMGMEEVQVNARNTTTYFSPIANGGVHPVESGYWQCADVYTAFLKNV